MMNTEPKSVHLSELTTWLRAATKGLCDPAKNRISTEITGHYDEAFQAAVERGATDDEARAAAMGELGRARKARRAFRRSHLARWQYSIASKWARSKPETQEKPWHIWICRTAWIPPWVLQQSLAVHCLYSNWKLGQEMPWHPDHQPWPDAIAQYVRLSVVAALSAATFAIFITALRRGLRPGGLRILLGAVTFLTVATVITLLVHLALMPEEHARILLPDTGAPCLAFLLVGALAFLMRRKLIRAEKDLEGAAAESVEGDE